MSTEQIDAIMVTDDHQVRGFFKEYRWLSNFHPCKITYEGLTYGSTEAAYQAAKTLNPEARIPFTTCTAAESKKLGREVSLRNDWDEVKDGIMFELLKQKFEDPELREKLRRTKGMYLEETNYWGDTYWGVCKSVGKNQLGKLLMLVATQID